MFMLNFATVLLFFINIFFIISVENKIHYINIDEKYYYPKENCFENIPIIKTGESLNLEKVNEKFKDLKYNGNLIFNENPILLK